MLQGLHAREFSRTLTNLLVASVVAITFTTPAQAQRTNKPVLHGKHWVAMTGKPLAATAGALTFARGGHAVDAAGAMPGATSTLSPIHT